MQSGSKTNFELLGGASLAALHDKAIEAWYADAPDAVPPGEDLESIVRAQHFCNVSLWGREDEARRRDVDDAYIAEIKRAIDGWNQKRNDLVERTDAFILAELDDVDVSNAALHSETAGMMVDRLSILSLKIWHMGAYAEREGDSELGRECLEKQSRLKIQRQDLLACLEQLIDEFQAGTRYYKIYRQFKAYNDPRLNPTERT